MMFIRPPYHPSTPMPSIGEPISRIGELLNNYLKERQADRDRQEQKQRQKTSDEIEGEDRLLRLLPYISGYQDDGQTPTPDSAPSDAANPAPSTASEPPYYLASPDTPKPPTASVPAAMPKRKPAAPLLTSVTMPGGRKIPVDIRGQKEAVEAAAQTKKNEGTEVLAQETWNNLPPIYQARWKPGDRIKSDQLGAVGMEMVREAAAKATADNKPEPQRAPSVTEFNGMRQQWIPNPSEPGGGHWTALGRAGKETAATPATSYDFQSDIHTGTGGQQWFNGASYKSKEDKAAARAFAKKQGIKFVDDPKVTDTLTGIAASTQDLDRIFGQIVPKLASGGLIDRAFTGQVNKAKSFTQSDSELAAFDSNWESFVRAALNVIPAGRGFRMTESEMRRILEKNRPSFFDNQATANQKKSNIVAALRTAEEERIGKGSYSDSTPSPASKGMKVGKYTVTVDE